MSGRPDTVQSGWPAPGRMATCRPVIRLADGQPAAPFRLAAHRSRSALPPRGAAMECGSPRRSAVLLFTLVGAVLAAVTPAGAQATSCERASSLGFAASSEGGRGRPAPAGRGRGCRLHHHGPDGAPDRARRHEHRGEAPAARWHALAGGYGTSAPPHQRRRHDERRARRRRDPHGTRRRGRDASSRAARGPAAGSHHRRSDDGGRRDQPGIRWTDRQGSAKTTRVLPRGAPYSSGAKPFIQPPQPVGTATYCLPATL